MHAIEKILAEAAGKESVTTGEIVNCHVDLAEVNDLYLQTIRFPFEDWQVRSMLKQIEQRRTCKIQSRRTGKTLTSITALIFIILYMMDQIIKWLLLLNNMF
jgi:hypothetical protein